MMKKGKSLKVEKSDSCSGNSNKHSDGTSDFNGTISV